MWCSCSTAGSCSPQVVVFAESVEQLLSYVLFGLCKIPSRSGETKSSLRTPGIGWKKPPSCVGEVGSGSARGRQQDVWVLGWRRKSYICREALLPFLRVSKTYGLLHRHGPLTGLPVFQASQVVFFLFPFIIELFFPLLLSSFPFSPLRFHDHFFFLCSSPSLSLFFCPVNMFRIDKVGLRDRLRCGIFQKMNYS